MVGDLQGAAHRREARHSPLRTIIYIYIYTWRRYKGREWASHTALQLQRRDPHSLSETGRLVMPKTRLSSGIGRQWCNNMQPAGRCPKTRGQKKWFSVSVRTAVGHMTRLYY